MDWNPEHLAPLPTGPDDHERTLYSEPKNRLLSATQVIAWIGLSLALGLFALNSIWLLPIAVWVVLGLAYFSLSFAANTSYRRFDLEEHDRLVARSEPETVPSVDVFLPSCGEATNVIENTFRHVAELEWDGDLRVYCLDDSGRPEIERLAESFGFTYLSRPNKGEFKKAGNLRYAYKRSDGNFIAVFDADMCPRPSFLRELVPYALADDCVGIVQSPQYFEASSGKNWLENGAGSVQEFFYRWVMPGRDQHRSPICVGTNAVYRRSALDATDGGALVENSEDVHTGFDLMARGYRTKYVPVILAKGLCPNDLRTFFNQQHRWCSGSMSLLFSYKFWHQPIGLRPRLTFLSGMTYFLYTGIGILILPIPTILMVCLFPEKVFWWNYALLVPALLQSFVFLPLWHRTPYGFDAMRTKMIYAWAHLFAFRDRLVANPLSWSPSGSSGSGGADRVRLVKILLVGYPLLSLAVVIAGSAIHMDSATDIDFLPPILATALYAATAIGVLRPLGATRYSSALRSRPSSSDPIASGVAAPIGATAGVMASTATTDAGISPASVGSADSPPLSPPGG